MKNSTRSIRLLCLGAVTAALAGCMPPPPPPAPAPPMAPFGLVPETGRKVAVGVPPLTFAAASTGPVYVLDETAMSLVATISPPANSTGVIIAIDPTLKAVTLQDAAALTARTTLASPIDPTHKFSIWASPSHTATQP